MEPLKRAKSKNTNGQPMSGIPLQSNGLKKDHTHDHSRPLSSYSINYDRYLSCQFPTVDEFLMKLVGMPSFKYYFLKYPLLVLLRAVVKKMQMNKYELAIYGYFLNRVDWQLDENLYGEIALSVPPIVHINQPAEVGQLHRLSLFLYMSCFSIKEYLNNQGQLKDFRIEMCRVSPQFETLQTYWASRQSTVGQSLNPSEINSFIQEVQKRHIGRCPADYNSFVDKVLHISPCYDIGSKINKGKALVPQFAEGMAELHNVKVELDDKDFEDFKEFNGVI